MIQYDYYSFLLFCIGKKGKQQDLINIMSTSLVASQSIHYRNLKLDPVVIYRKTSKIGALGPWALYPFL